MQIDPIDINEIVPKFSKGRKKKQKLNKEINKIGWNWKRCQWEIVWKIHNFWVKNSEG